MEFGYTDAVTVIAKAIESGKIALTGPGGDVENSQRRADIDAAYLIRLLEKLAGGGDSSQPL